MLITKQNRQSLALITMFYCNQFHSLQKKWKTWLYSHVTIMKVDWDRPSTVLGCCNSITVSILPSSVFGTTIFWKSTQTEFNLNKQVQKINMYKFTWKWRSSFIFHATLKIQCTINYRYSLFLLKLNKSTYFFSIMWTYFLPKSK